MALRILTQFVSNKSFAGTSTLRSQSIDCSTRIQFNNVPSASAQLVGRRSRSQPNINHSCPPNSFPFPRNTTHYDNASVKNHILKQIAHEASKSNASEVSKYGRYKMNDKYRSLDQLEAVDIMKAICSRKLQDGRRGLQPKNMSAYGKLSINTLMTSAHNDKINHKIGCKCVRCSLLAGGVSSSKSLTNIHVRYYSTKKATTTDPNKEGYRLVKYPFMDFREEDPDCPWPREKIPRVDVICPNLKYASKCCAVDCPPPPCPKIPPVVPLPKIDKQPVVMPELKMCCLDICPPRADANLKPKIKVLPCLKPNNCPCVEPGPLTEFPVCRLNKRPVLFDIEICKEDVCEPSSRADYNMKVVPKKLPLLKPGPCPCPEPELDEGEPLKRLVPKKVLEPCRFSLKCKEKEPCCRADENLCVKPKELPPAVFSDCECVEPPELKEGCPPPRLVKRKVCEPVSHFICPVEPCPPRADIVCKYVVKEKYLPTMIICCNNISAREFNQKRDEMRMNEAESQARCYSTLTTANKLNSINSIQTRSFSSKAPTKKPKIIVDKTKYLDYEECFPEIDLSQYDWKGLCNKIEKKYDKNICCECVEPYLPSYLPKLRRLEKKYSTSVDPPRILPPECLPPCANIIRADDGKDFAKRKKLPCISSFGCECVEPPPMKPCPTELVRLTKRPVCPDVVDRVCIAPCPKTADEICEYEVKKKKLRPILTCQIECIEVPPIDKKSYSTLAINFKPHNSIGQFRTFFTTPSNIQQSKQNNSSSGGSRKQVCEEKKTKKSECKTFKSCCPPRQRWSCKYVRVDVPCKKIESPYKSFRECSDWYTQELISECPKYNYLQPKFPIIPHIEILPPAPPEFAYIDPTVEEECVRGKLCIENRGISKNCENYNEPFWPMRQMDHIEIIKRDRCGKEVMPCPVIDTQTCEEQTCTPDKKKVDEAKRAEEASMKEAADAEKKKQKKGSKTIPSTKTNVCKLPPLNKDARGMAHQSSSINLPSNECNDKKRKKCISEDLPHAEKTEAKDDDCPSCPKPIICTEKSLWQKILDFFRARPNCPSPEELRQRELRRRAEEAAKAAGLELCTPAETVEPEAEKECEEEEEIKEEEQRKPATMSERCKKFPMKNHEVSRNMSSFFSTSSVHQSSRKNKCGKDEEKKKKECTSIILKNCPPKDPCLPPPRPECCVIESPFPAYTDCQLRFKRLRYGECEEQKLRIKKAGDMIAKYSLKIEREKRSKRRYSTFSQVRYYSSKSKKYEDLGVLHNKVLEEKFKNLKDKSNDVQNVLNILENIFTSEQLQWTMQKSPIFMNFKPLEPMYFEDYEALEQLKTDLLRKDLDDILRRYEVDELHQDM